MAIKPSLVEHIFRQTWAAHAEEAGAAGATTAAAAVAAALEDDGSEDVDSAEETPAPGRTPADVTKIHPDALKLSAEFLRLFIGEAFERMQMEAMIDDSETIEPHHVEHILAQLLLDF